MDERGKMLLRSRFEAETNKQISPNPEDWQCYAEWLEGLNIRELNEELIKQNEAFRGLISGTIQMLEEEAAKI